MKIIITESQYKLLMEGLADDDVFRDTIKGYESTVTDSSGQHYTFDDKDPKNPKTFVKTSADKKGGTLTIGWGHTGETAKPGKKISNQKAEELLTSDITKEENKAKTIFPKYTSYPLYVQRALVNAVYRGEAKSTYEWVKSVNSGKWITAAKEYLEGWDIDFSQANNPKYKGGVADRMVTNKKAFEQYGEELKKGKTTTTTTKKETTTTESTYSTEGISYVMLENELASLTSGKNYKLHRFPKDSFFNFRLEVGPYPPSKKEGRYLVFFRNGVIKWYNGNEFSGRGSWGYNIDQNKWRIIGKNGEISLSTAINNPVSNFAKIG